MKPEEYPLAELPPIIKDAVEEVQGYIQAPVALVAACALSVVSTAVQARFDIQRDTILSGPSSLYFLTVAESGERKSAIDKLFTAPLSEWQAKQARAYREKQAQYEVAMEAWKERGQQLEDLIASGMYQDKVGTAFCPRHQHEAAMPRPPRKAEVLRGDDTTVALLMGMQDYPVAAVISAEAGIIFGSHSMNAEQATGNLSIFNLIWDGAAIRQRRAGREPIDIEKPRGTVGLMVQETVLRGFVARTGDLAKGIGYFARFLFSQPDSTMGTRYYARNLPDGKRHEFLRDAIARDDSETVTAMLGAPPYLSGLNHEFQAVYLRLYHERNSPGLAKRLKVMRAAKELIESNAGKVFTEMEKAIGGKGAKANMVRKAQEAAEKALGGI